ncbi:MAG: hypothetical protein R6V06_08390 [Kiritimatiellia bacterium]
MLQRIFTKYWIVANVGCTVVLTWLVLPESVKTVSFAFLFWMSVILCEFLVLLPSVYRGETLAEARLRVVRSLSSDPFLYAGFFLIIYLAAQWYNGGSEPVYDASANVWNYSRPDLSWLPSGVYKMDSFRLTNIFAAIVAAGVCIRNAVGKRAKRRLLQWLCSISGLYAVYAVFSGCLDVSPYCNLMMNPESSSMGTLFGFWCLISIGAYAEAQSVRQRRTELLYLAGIVFNFIGLLFFAPLPALLLYSVAGLFLLVYAGVYLSFHVPSGFLIKFYLLCAIILTIIILFPLFLVPESAVVSKVGLFSDFTAYWTELFDSKTVRLNAAMSIWEEHMWVGVGANGFEHYLGFVINDADWRNVVLNKGCVYNDPVQILCEFGLLGSAAIAALIVTLLMPLCYRAHVAWVKNTEDCNAGRPYLLRISPFVFTGVVVTLCCFGESFIFSPFRYPAVVMSFFIVVLCMPGFLPSR